MYYVWACSICKNTEGSKKLDLFIGNYFIEPIFTAVEKDDLTSLIAYVIICKYI